MQTETVTAAMQELAPEIRRLHARDLASISRRFDVDDLVQTTALKAISAAANCQADSLEQLRHWVLSIARRTTKSAILELAIEKGTGLAAEKGVLAIEKGTAWDLGMLNWVELN